MNPTAGAREHLGRTWREKFESQTNHQKVVFHWTTAPDPEIPACRLLEPVHVAQPYKVKSFGPGVELLHLPVLIRRHENYRLEDVAPDQVVRISSRHVSHCLVHYGDTVRDNRESIPTQMFGPEPGPEPGKVVGPNEARGVKLPR